MARTGRPTRYTKNLGAKICKRIAEGESLRIVCKDEDMPKRSTVFRWLLDERYKDFWEQHAQARDMQADATADETVTPPSTRNSGRRAKRS